MPVSLSPSMIQGVVVAIIVFLIQLLFLEFLVLANANMQREISNHCDFGSFTTVKIRTGQTLANAGTVYTLKEGTDTKNPCGIPGFNTPTLFSAAGHTSGDGSIDSSGDYSSASSSIICGTNRCYWWTEGGTSHHSSAAVHNIIVGLLAGKTYYSEDGNLISEKSYRVYRLADGKSAWGAAPDSAGQADITLTHSIAPNATWKDRPLIVNQFHGIISIIGEIIPLLLVVAVASEAFMLVYLRNSQGGISGVVSSRVALLVIAYVVILFGGTVFEFAESSLQVFSSTAVSGTDRFKDIAQLLLSLIPLAYELLVLGILGWNTASAYRAVRSRFARSGNNNMRSIGQGM